MIMAGMKLIPEQRQTTTFRFTPMLDQPAVGLEVQPERATDRELPAELVETVAKLIEAEDRAQPMSDSELAAAVADESEQLGADVTRADIALARRQLGLGTAEERLIQYRE
jgi:hypothetical protein